ncbi:MAG: hypothetical protein ACOC3W_08960 [Thermodesulfobacteriota bacterium]
MSLNSHPPSNTPHDQNFKNLILDYPLPALRFFAGPEAEGITPEARITPIRQEQLKERLGERFRELDIPLLVEWPDGRRAAVLFVIEEETDPGRFSIHRLAHYCLDLAELLNTNRVVPVVIFLRPGSFPAELRLGGDRDDYLIFRFIPCDLGRIPAMIHLDSRNIVARLNLPNMAYPEDQRIEVYAKAQEGLVALEKDMDKRKKYVDFIDMYADLSNDEIVRYQAEWLSSSRVKEEMMGLRKTFMQEGREEGRREGLMKAIEIGLTLKFGKNSLGILKTISQTADVNQLDALSDKILTVKDISELRQYIKTLSSEHSWTH